MDRHVGSGGRQVEYDQDGRLWKCSVNLEFELKATTCFEITIKVHIKPYTICLTKDKLAFNEYLSTQSEVIQKLLLQNYLLVMNKTQMVIIIIMMIIITYFLIHVNQKAFCLVPLCKVKASLRLLQSTNN
jgi:hypothetical protein